jgi:ankyrin repeat protein
MRAFSSAADEAEARNKVNAQLDAEHRTALHVCVAENQPSMLDYLLQYTTCNVEVEDSRGFTPLMEAASHGHVPLLIR